MLLNTVTNTVTNLLAGPAAANKPANAAQTAADALPNAAAPTADNAPEQNHDGVKFDFSDRALEAAGNSAAQTSPVIAQTVAAPVAPVETTGPAAEANPTKSASPQSGAGMAVVEGKPTASAAVLDKTAEPDPSEEARARAHAEQELETSRLRNLAIGGYEDSRKLFGLISADARAADSKAEAAPLRQALIAV